MARDCYICGERTIFYVWTTSRYFPKRELIKLKGLKTKYEQSKISTEGFPICMRCYNKLKKIKASK